MQQVPGQTNLGPIEWIIHWSLRQRALVIMLVALMAILGAASLRRLPMNVYPDIAIPVFTIVTENEAMAPEEIEMMITRPIEASMNGLPGVRRIRSQTTQGLSSVVVDFDIETDFWRARQFVMERLSQITAQLPPGTEPPTVSSATTRLAEVYEYAVEGDLPLAELREIAEWQIRYNILTVPGVAEVLNMGGELRQYRVNLDPEKMIAYGVSLSDIEEAVKKGNENSSGGFISTGPTEYTVRGIGRYASLNDIKDTVVAERNGVPIYLWNIASIEEGTAVRRGIASKNGRETVVALVIKQPNADTNMVVRGVEKAIDEMKASLPEGVRIVPYYDQTHLIEHSISGVTRAILFGALLVIFILPAFLGSLRSTLIVAASLPLSVMIAGMPLKWLGVGLNTMSLGGLAIAVGIMVDASIIMVENSHHRLHGDHAHAHLEGVDERERIVGEAAVEVARPVIFATAIIIAVFFPLFIMGGIEGLLFRSLALTVGVAMVVSLLLSITLVPVLSKLLLRPRRDGDPQAETRLVKHIKALYMPLLEYALRYKLGLIILTIGLLLLAAIGMTFVGKSFMPRLDEGSWVISTITPPETSLEENNRITGKIETLLLKDPNVDEVIRRNGRSERAIGCVLPVNSGEIIVNLKPRNRLTKPTEQILAEIRDQVERIPGVAAAFTQPLQMKIDESLEGTPAPLQVKLFGPDLDVLAKKGRQIEEIVRSTKGIADVKMDQPSGIPQIQISIDRQAAARYGLSMGDLSKVIRLAIGGEELTQVWRNQRSYGVFVRFREDVRNNLDAIRNIPIDTPSGARIPLSQIASVELEQGPNVIWREGMQRRLSIDASIQNRDLEGVVSDIRRKLENLELPEDYFIAFGGQFQNQQRAMRSLMLAVAVSLVVIFMLLFVALNSAREAGMILGTVPCAFIGGIASLLLAKQTLNVSSAVGFIALFGIAVQNSLVLLTQTRGFMAEGHTREKAIRLASVQRLRPKLMTAVCAGFGVIPILASRAAGVEIEKPLAIVLLGGLVTSTLFTLLVLPAVFLLLERIEFRSRR